jgi:hypothetical protein
MHPLRMGALAWVLWLLWTPLLRSDTVDFVRDVRPIFVKHCYGCHSEETPKSGLRLDIKSEAFRGGDAYGPSIVANQVDASPIVELVSATDDSRMPPEGDGLLPEEISTLRLWIEQGASWPAGVDTAKLVDRKDHWSFKPIQQQPAPSPRDEGWARNDIDRFILTRLQQEELEPAHEADPTSWLRRVYLDMLGLPPSPQAIEAFVSDHSEEAHAAVVDELLASKHYGEHWAQHWLDVVRYADTDGFEVNTPRANAWPYRDYVIAAFNDDKPYDQFIREQIAGDAMGQDAATGFLVTAAALLPGQIGKDEPSKRLARQDELAEVIINTGEAFLGLSIGCARCHDHKFDAISQRDYYAMQAFLSGLHYGERPLRNRENSQDHERIAAIQAKLAEIDKQIATLNSDAQLHPTMPQLNEETFEAIEARFVRFAIYDANHHPTLGLIEPCIDEFEIFAVGSNDSPSENVALATRGTKVTASGSRESSNHKLSHLNDGKYGNSFSWMSDEAGQGWVLLELAEPVSINRVVWSRDREGQFADRLATAYALEAGATLETMQLVAGLSVTQVAERRSLSSARKSLEEEAKQLGDAPVVFAGIFTTPEPTFLLARGDAEQPLEPVAPAVPSALADIQLPDDASDLERRQTLAGWIASRDNPLTARVMANRVWQWHFGTGLVETASDFGRNGAPPSHPELLDWLAQEFMDSGWSIKSLHRFILLSSTYRQSSAIDPGAVAKDGDVRWLWRFPARRLEAESIRDSMLAVSGQLNLFAGGPGFDLFKSRGGLSGFPPIESFKDAGLRRMIYAHKIRMEREAVFGAFDCPDAGQSTARRRQSTTPIQALNLFNSRFTLDQADAFAERIKNEVGDEPTQQTTRAFLLAFGRKPDHDELQEIVPTVQRYGLPTLCRVIFNSNEFLFVP